MNTIRFVLILCLCGVIVSATSLSGILRGIREKDRNNKEKRGLSSDVIITTCPTYGCVNLNQSCGTRASPTGEIISQINCNGYDNYCLEVPIDDGFEGKCSPLPTLGQPCAQTEDGSDCARGLMCSLFNETCVPYGDSDHKPGTACTYDSECIFQNTTERVYDCVDGKCLFIPDGQPCSFDQCNSLTSYCLDVCKPFTANGQPCEFSFECADTCLPVNTSSVQGVCGAENSRKEGEPCSGALQCLEGLFCGDKPEGEVWGVCTRPVNTTATYLQPCTSDSNCTGSNHESCECYAAIANHPICVVTILPSSYYDASRAVDTCISQSGCPFDDEACEFQACTSQACAFLKVFSQITNFWDGDCSIKNYTDICANLPTPSPSTPSPPPSSASSLFFLSSFLLSFVFVLVTMM